MAETPEPFTATQIKALFASGDLLSAIAQSSVDQLPLPSPYVELHNNGEIVLSIAVPEMVQYDFVGGPRRRRRGQDRAGGRLWIGRVSWPT